MRFGRLIGAGQAGFVFQNMDNPKHYYKLVALPRYPLSKYPVRSLDRKLYAVNLMQAELFERLAASGNQPSSLPKVYSFVKGKTDPSLRRQLISSSEDFDWDDEIDDLLRDFRTGQPYAIWEMEAIPCTDANDYCQKYDSTVSPLNNSDYQDLLRYLLSQGFVVRDIRNPENFGFRVDGSQVFFDPVVAPWPLDNSNQQLLDAFTGTFGNDLVTVERAIESGDYFNWYHGQAIMQSEEESAPHPQITTFAELQKFWNDHNLYPGSDGNLEQMVEWEESPINVIKYPQHVTALNWIENQEELALEMRVESSKVLSQVWKNFVDFWDYEFSELWYGQRNTPTLSYNSEPLSPIFELIEKDFTLQEVVTPATTTLFRIVNDPAAFKELTENDLADEMIDEVYNEQVMVRELMLNAGRGNHQITAEAFYNWVRKYTTLNRMVLKDKPYKVHARTKRPYLPSFSPPTGLIHYPSLYDGRGSEEVDIILREYDLDDFHMTWSIYLD
jgi:hypothetical protein